jgi:hypothetical protein
LDPAWSRDNAYRSGWPDVHEAVPFKQAIPVSLVLKVTRHVH